jgi:raffinose/stachyose/melibiose transport system substrate-binding protein
VIPQNMKKHYVTIGMIAILLAGCQKESDSKPQKEAKIEKKVVLDIRNPKVEIASEFEELAKVYEKENPEIDIRIRTVGGAADDYSDLKAELASGKGPDIFTNTGYGNAETWRPYLEDLSKERWVKDAYPGTLDAIKMDGNVYGMPMNLEGYGFIYNKELFQRAGVERAPETLTELKKAAAQLEQKGITTFATGYYEDWKLGVHLLNVAFARQKNPDAFIKKLNAGEVQIPDNPLFQDVIDLLDVTLKYGNADPLTTDYNMEVDLFAKEKTSMILQGNWIQPMIDERAPDLDVAFMPIPINDEPTDQLVVSVPNYWVVNKQADSSDKKEAKRFLNWMVSSKKGQSFITKRFKFIPVFKNIKTDDLGPLAKETMDAYEKGNTLDANWNGFPAGVKEEFGSAMQMYVGKQLTREQLLREFQLSWDRARETQE